MDASSSNPPAPSGIPPGMIDAVLAILRAAPGPVRRRPLLEELARRGRTVSLAGLNRVLEHTKQAGLTRESEAGVLLLGRT